MESYAVLSACYTPFRSLCIMAGYKTVTIFNSYYITIKNSKPQSINTVCQVLSLSALRKPHNATSTNCCMWIRGVANDAFAKPALHENRDMQNQSNQNEQVRPFKKTNKHENTLKTKTK